MSHREIEALKWKYQEECSVTLPSPLTGIDWYCPAQPAYPPLSCAVQPVVPLESAPEYHV